MVMAVATMNDGAYNYLAPYTWDQNGLKYCEAWDYPYAVLTDGEGMQPGYAKMSFLLDLCEEHPEVEWILWKDCDSLITNFSIKIEDLVDNSCHFMVSTYWNGINAGMFMLRNSPEGRDYVRMILDLQSDPSCPNEQEAIIKTYEQYKDNIVKIVPQRMFNAACFFDGCHPERGVDPRNHQDVLGQSGQWLHGDFIMHWPGQNPQLRLHLARKYLQQVVPASARIIS